MTILDTNVLSEGFRLRPADAVARWIRVQPPASLFTTTISEAEIFFGLALMNPGRRRTTLEQGFARLFGEEFADRILPFDNAAARMFAEISATRRALGRPIHQFDAQIAAISRSRAATVATRDVDDFADCGIKVINPWEGIDERR